MEDQIGDFLVFGVAVLRFLDDELDALGLGSDDAEAASGGLVLLDQYPNRRSYEGSPELDLCVLGNPAVLNQSDRAFIDAVALGSRVRGSLGGRQLDEVVAIELIALG